MRILIFGGSTEASTLSRKLVDFPAAACVLSLAGRTSNPTLPPIPYRVGGFGGVAGLIAYLRREAFNMVIDATHPFAERMSMHAEAACREVRVPLVVFTRPPWMPTPDDRWIEAADARSAAVAIGQRARRVFLAVGRLQLAAFEAAPQHDYLIRTIDLPDPEPLLPQYRVLLMRGPFTVEGDLKLMKNAAIEVVVTKNSGGDAARAKLDAARELGIEVIVIRPPPRRDVTTFHDLADLLHFLREHSLNPAP